MNWTYVALPRGAGALSLATGVCVRRVLHHWGIEGVTLKWPNDLYVFDKKMAGILIQNAIGAGRKIESSVVGIGLNVNQVSWPAGLPNPTSLKLETGLSFDLLPLVEILCNCLEIRYLQLKTSPKSLTEHYLQNLYFFGEMADFVTRDGTFFSGKITGIRPDGRLVISQKNGATSDWEVKEIRFAHLPTG